MDDNTNFGPDYVTLVDDEGKEYQLELLDSIELDGKTYLAFCEADLPEDSEAIEVTILRRSRNFLLIIRRECGII